ncbi:unnamed protein product [Orchesella dallaii]|uniref:FMRFamide receptor n=1 Tax=Orchesella dallaii TaxID=48710 RepID=A0ABP1S798_9HEXA
MAQRGRFVLGYNFLNENAMQFEVNEENYDENNTLLLSNFTTNSTFFQNISNISLPIDMVFNGGHVLAIVLYTLQLIVSAIGNVYVFSVILRESGRKRIFWTANRCCMVECESGDEETSHDLPRASSTLPGLNNSGDCREEGRIPCEMREENSSSAAIPMRDTSVIGSPRSDNKSGSDPIAVGGQCEYVESPGIPTVSMNVGNYCV